MLTDVDLNNFVSFGVLATDGIADVHSESYPYFQITFTVNDRTVLNICAKGVPVSELL